MTRHSDDLVPGERAQLRAIAARIDDSPSVACRSGGVLGTVAAYLPGERIAGFRLREASLEVHVVMRYGFTVDDVERDVLDAVRAEAPAARVDIVVDDVAVEPLADRSITSRGTPHAVAALSS